MIGSAPAARLLAAVLSAGPLLAGAAWCAPARAQDCVRSEPAPLFTQPFTAIRAHRFTATSDHEGQESFEFGQGVRVEVSHGGCEYFVTTYRFSAPGLFADGYSQRKAYAAAAGLLRELDRLRPATPSKLDMAARTLDAQAHARAAPAFDSELAVEGDGVAPLQGQVKLDAAGRQKTMGFVQVTLFRGPL